MPLFPPDPLFRLRANSQCIYDKLYLGGSAQFFLCFAFDDKAGKKSQSHNIRYFPERADTPGQRGWAYKRPRDGRFSIVFSLLLKVGSLTAFRMSLALPGGAVSFCFRFWRKARTFFRPPGDSNQEMISTSYLPYKEE